MTTEEGQGKPKYRSRSFSSIIAIALLVFWTAASPADNETKLDGPGVMPPGLPFSPVVRAGDTYYLSGQIGARPGTLELVPGGIGAEARQALENIRAILATRELTMDDLVKCTVMLADIDDWAEFNQIYRTFFETTLPARSAFAASGLALNGRVEIDCIAHAPELAR